MNLHLKELADLHSYLEGAVEQPRKAMTRISYTLVKDWPNVKKRLPKITFRKSIGLAIPWI